MDATLIADPNKRGNENLFVQLFIVYGYKMKASVMASSKIKVYTRTGDKGTSRWKEKSCGSCRSVEGCVVLMMNGENVLECRSSFVFGKAWFEAVLGSLHFVLLTCVSQSLLF
jgi:hypothetical protein